MKLKLIRLFLFLILLFSIERFCYKQTRGFRLYKIQSASENHKPFENGHFFDSSCENLREILSQSFHFFGSGQEAYAFISEDGQHVLKFLRYHGMRSTIPTDFLLPCSYRKKRQNQRIKKANRLINSCKLALEYFKKETGLVYLHLNPSDHLRIQAPIFDAIGCVHYIDLDAHMFALQKRAHHFLPYLLSLIAKNDFESFEARIKSCVKLIADLCDMGVSGRDLAYRNLGYIDNEAVILDLGCFSSKRPLEIPLKKDQIVEKQILKLKKSIKKMDPKYEPFFERAFRNHLSEKTNLSYHRSNGYKSEKNRTFNVAKQAQPDSFFVS